jgi:predicted transcriptional regulator
VLINEPKGLYTIAFYIVAMVTTIQVSEKLVDVLRTKKMYDKESYEDVIWDALEDTMELSEETKKQIEKARKEIKAGKFYTHGQVKKELGL